MAIEHVPIYKPPKKTIQEQFTGYVVFFVIVYVIWMVLEAILKAIAYPFKMMITSDREKFAASVKTAKKKVEIRHNVRSQYANEPTNPFCQYVERFKVRPEDFHGDPHNTYYEEWFQALQNGTILDSKLIWAPEIYEEDICENIEVSKDFLEYFSCQVQLHLNSSFPNKIAFLKTVRSMYPEFTPKFSVMLSEIENLQEKVKTQDIRSELIKAITAKGIPATLANELINISQDINDIQKFITISKACLERGLKEKTCIFCIQTGYDPNDAFAESIDTIVSDMKCDFLAKAFIRKDLTSKETMSIINSAIAAETDYDKIMTRIQTNFKNTLKTKCQVKLVGR